MFPLNGYALYLNSLQLNARLRHVQDPLCENGEEAAGKVVDFSSNDYLALSKDPRLLAAAHAAGQRYGVGSGGARLLSGNVPLIRELERAVAQSLGQQQAVVFSSGFLANASTLSCLLAREVLPHAPLVFFDKNNHASLYTAVQWAKDATLVRYRHNDMHHLEQLLQKSSLSPHQQQAPKFIVTETLFGMDGDSAPLQDIAFLARKYGAFVYLDEAHAVGMCGKGGAGLSTTVDLSGIPHMVMGTFGKALGCEGAYVACEETLAHYIQNRAKGFVYSTAPSPMVMGAALRAWELLETMDEARLSTMQRTNELREGLQTMGFSVIDPQGGASHIVPLVLGDERRAMQAKQKLAARGVLVSCVRPPTVPPATSRLRLAVHAGLTHEDIALCLEYIREVL